MNASVQKFVKICPKTGRIRKITLPGGFYKIFFPIIGLAALLWIIIRVVPKPTRAEYPCVKAATPIATGFVVYLISLAASAIIYIKTKKKIFLSPYIATLALVFFGFTGNYLLNNSSDDSDIKLPNSIQVANSPTGEAKGIFPGRVVWAYDPNATNENCNPTDVGHAWWMPENNNQTVIDGMVSKVIQSLTGETTDKNAWDAIFKYHNNTRGKGEVNYQSGEKIFIKINNVSGWGGNFSTSDLSVVANGSYGIAETSPEIILSVLRQLVNTVGAAQSDIYVGDPLRNTYKHCYDMWHSEFPDVHYVSHDNYSRLGRERFVASTTARIFYSDKGAVLRPNVWSTDTNPNGTPITDDYLYTIFEDAEYLLNVPMLKGHKRAGMTMFAKNHFGSHTRNDASHLHNGVVDPIEKNDNTSRREYGMYRVQVDIMAHKLLGEKNLFYLMDALWTADQEISFPKKFTMAPFNNDWMSSVFASLDPVAIESVGYDFLRSEFTSTRSVGDGAGTYPQKPAADDYLHQASDSALWAEDIKYDPNNDGNYFASLGTHEHWNNETDKQYSRNLGTGDGIELLKILDYTDVEKELNLPAGYNLSQNYPNPFNPTTKISYSIPTDSRVVIKIYDAAGREVETIENNERTAGTYTVTFDAKQLSSGVYYYKLTTNNYTAAKKFVLIK
ncbi:MAG: T9SS type A sorting domain-containing protein [Ignavibacteria bacterium]